MNTYQPLRKTGSEPESKKTPPLAISSIGTENTKKNASQMPFGSVILTGTGSAPNDLKNQGITHIIHAAMLPLNSDRSNEAKFIETATLAIRNAIIVAETHGLRRLATCFLGGELYCSVPAVRPPLAEAIVEAALVQLIDCPQVDRVFFVDFSGDYYRDAFEKFKWSGSLSTVANKVRVVKGDLCKKKVPIADHDAEAIVNSENASMGWGGGISGAISNALGATAANEVDAERKGLMNEFNSLIEKENNNGGEKYTCPQCGKEYNTKDKPLVEGKYCSRNCKEAAKPNETQTCIFCSKTIDVGRGESVFFYRDKSGVLKKFCSQEHMDEYKKKEKPSEPTDNLSQIRTQALSVIQTALNSEPKLTASDLSSDYQDYENKLNQLNSENEINDLKEKVLQDIQVKRKAKEDEALNEKINSAKTEAEKVDLFKETGKKIGEETPERAEKLEQIKNELAANPIRLRTAIQYEITAQMIAFEVKPEDLKSDIRNQLESLKTEKNATKIREIEKTVSQAVGKTGVNLKISRLEAEITAVLQSKDKTKIEAIKTQLLQLISSPNTFYQAQKSQFQNLLKKLKQEEKQSQVPDKSKFPLEIVVPISLAVVVGIIGLVIVFKKRKTKSKKIS